MSTSRITAWLVLSRDPLIFRDGRPFEAVPGSRARSLPFPHPTTLAGALRTREGFQKHGGNFEDNETVQALLQRRIWGPYLAEKDNQGQLRAWYIPAPQDALWVKEGDAITRYWLRPVEAPGITEMPDRPDKSENLRLVGPKKHIKAKPYRQAPAFWSWEALKEWLVNPQDGPVVPESVGLPALLQESRMHVHIDPGTHTAKEGFLFQTTGLRFVFVPDGKGWPEARHLALLVRTDAEIDEGIGYLGGERRAVYWEPVDWSPPSPPEEVLRSAERGAVRMMLVSPAYFEKGYLPTWLQNAVESVQANVQAVVLTQRAVAISGWDMKAGHEKPSRRLVPAGAVYYLRLEGSPEARRRFVETLWFQPVSDAEQDRRDGLGQVVFGVWNDQPEEAQDA